ncbi:O-acyltransferase [Cercospora zeina]
MPLPSASGRDAAQARRVDDGTRGLERPPSSSNASQERKEESKDRGPGHSTSNSSSDSDDDDLMDNYDDLEVDPDTLIVNSRTSIDVALRPSNATMGDARPVHDEPPLKHARRNSIQVNLKKTDRKGRYILTADDPAIREVLRKGIEREEEEKGNKKRMRFRDLVFTRRFTRFDRQNPSSSDSPFFGFFTLFWICMFLIFVQVALRNWREYGSVLGGNQVFKLMMSRDVVLLGVTDLAMCLLTTEGLLFQKLVLRRWIKWSRTGWIIQNLWQAVYLGSVVAFAYYRDWPWTHTIFVVLHGLVFVMKQHSYAFYNGYLSTVYRRKQLLQEKLVELDRLEPIQSPPTSPISENNDMFTTAVDVAQMSAAMRRRSSFGPKTSINLQSEESDVAAVAKAIACGQRLSAEQMQVMVTIIDREILELNKELRGKADSDNLAYPNNLTLYNSIEWICLPTLVYELAYPRQEKINWWKVRGYLFTMQLMQMPLVMLSKTKFLRDKVVLGNAIFWFGLFIGPSLLTSLYLVV